MGGFYFGDLNVYIVSRFMRKPDSSYMKTKMQLLHTCLLYTDNSNFFLNPKFQASKFCDCVEGILSEEGFSRAVAHVKVVSHNYLQRFSHRTQ